MRGGRGLPNDMTTQVIAGLEDLLTAGLRSADSADPLPGLVSYLQGALARREGKCETEVSPAASPEWTVKGWLAPLGVSSCVALALLPDAPLGVTPNEHAALRALELTSAEAIAEHLRAGGLLEKIAELLLPSLVALSESPEAAAAPDAIDRQTKFAGNELDFSGLDVFFDGLEERVGVPRANTKGYMKNEHTSEADARCEFTTNNYGITTTSAVEWAFVVDADGSYPTEAEGRLDRSMCRKPVPLADILARGGFLGRRPGCGQGDGIRHLVTLGERDVALNLGAVEEDAHDAALSGVFAGPLLRALRRTPELDELDPTVAARANVGEGGVNPGDLDVLLRSLLGLLVGFRVVTLIHPVDGVGVVVLEEPVRSLRLDRRHHTLEPDHGNLRRGPYVGPLVRPDLERDHVARSRVALSVLKAAAVVPESDFTLSRRLDRVPVLLFTLLLLGSLFGS